MVGAPWIQLLGLAVGAAVLAVTVRLVPVLVAAMVRSPLRRERLARLGPALELIAWTSYIAVGAAWLWNVDAGAAGMRTLVGVGLSVLGVALLGAWRIVRDYLVGVVVRGEATWRPGDRVLIGDVEGRVISLGYRAVCLQRRDGDFVFVPYGRMASDVLVRRHAEGDVVRHTFLVPCPAPLVPSDAVPRVREAALLHHWSSPGHDPEVGVDPDGTLEVTIHALSEPRVAEVEAAIRACLEGHS